MCARGNVATIVISPSSPRAKRMSLSLYGVPDGQQKGQSVWPCPSVYSPATALGSLSSVALSSAPASLTLAQTRKRDANDHHFCARIWSGFLVEATNTISSGFLREATGELNLTHQKNLPQRDCVVSSERIFWKYVCCASLYSAINRPLNVHKYRQVVIMVLLLVGARQPGAQCRKQEVRSVNSLT